MDRDEKTDWECDIKIIKASSKIWVNKVDLFDQTKIVHEFNSFFTNVLKNLTSKFLNGSTLFEYFVSKSDFVMETKPLSLNELKITLFSSESNKSPGYENIRYNVIKECFVSLLPCFSKILERARNVLSFV